MTAKKKKPVIQSVEPKIDLAELPVTKEELQEAGAISSDTVVNGSTTEINGVTYPVEETIHESEVLRIALLDERVQRLRNEFQAARLGFAFEIDTRQKQIREIEHTRDIELKRINRDLIVAQDQNLAVRAAVSKKHNINFNEFVYDEEVEGGVLKRIKGTPNPTKQESEAAVNQGETEAPLA